MISEAAAKFIRLIVLILVLFGIICGLIGCISQFLTAREQSVTTISLKIADNPEAKLIISEFRKKHRCTNMRLLQSDIKTLNDQMCNELIKFEYSNFLIPMVRWKLKELEKIYIGVQN